LGVFISQALKRDNIIKTKINYKVIASVFFLLGAGAGMNDYNLLGVVLIFAAAYLGIKSAE
jgi:hypothetical protein